MLLRDRSAALMQRSSSAVGFLLKAMSDLGSVIVSTVIGEACNMGREEMKSSGIYLKWKEAVIE